MQPFVPGDDAERASDRQWRLARVHLAIAVGWAAFVAVWWFVDDAPWQRPLFSVLAVALLVAAISNVRQQRRNRVRDASAHERDDPR